MKTLLSLIVLCCILAVQPAVGAAAGAPAPQRPSQTRKVWFENTPYELNVYRIYGRRPGKTMLIIGGIQGDEPGGFLSADLYVDMHLDKGDIIVVPRANFKSIILYSRGPEGDMNRQFHQRHNGNLSPSMTSVVQVIQKLMQEADVFLNLHDGRGFHRPSYVDELRNPEKFGQSVVIDTDVFRCENNGKTLALADTAKKMLADINDRIADPDHHLYLFNTKTDSGKGHISSEMRKTATWYALTYHCIPSFGIESSKNLPSVELKVRYHNDAINAFMSHYGIVPESPPLFLPPPSWSYLLVAINDELKTIFPGSPIVAKAGDLLSIKHVEANYSRGISCDLEGIGSVNDIGKEFALTRSTKLLIRKDERKIGEIDILLHPGSEAIDDVWRLKLSVNGRSHLIRNGETLKVRKNDIVILERAFRYLHQEAEVMLNFKGFVPAKKNRRSSEDDRGYPIRLDGNLRKKFSVDADGRRWPVVAVEKSLAVAEFFIEIES